MNDEERQAMNASANQHSLLGSLSFEQGWKAARSWMLYKGYILRDDYEEQDEDSRR